MDISIEFHWTKTQRGSPAIQIGTDLYRIQKHNDNGSIRFTCTDERCNASVTLLENKIKFIREVHRLGERILPFHIGAAVHEFQQIAVSDIKTPLPQIYDRVAKKFVHLNYNYWFFSIYLFFSCYACRDANMEQQQKCQYFNK